MRRKILYTCELCHTDYAEERKAQKCEKSHKQKLKIVDARYRPFTTNTTGLPDTIIIETEEGNKVTYHR